MRLSENDVNKFLELSCTPTIVCDHALLPVSANVAMLDLLGISTSNLPKKDLFSYFEDPQVIRTAIENVELDGPLYKDEVSLSVSNNTDLYNVSVGLLEIEAQTLFVFTLCPVTGMDNASQLKLDSLTGLPRYDLFIDRIEQAMIAAQRINKSVAVLMIGLDQLDRIVDGYGYETGNQV